MIWRAEGFGGDLAVAKTYDLPDQQFSTKKWLER
jgi:hypothetical protein